MRGDERYKLLNAKQETLARNLEKLYREMGPEITSAMQDPKVVEVMLNEDGIVWTDRLGEEGMTEYCTMDVTSALQMLGTIAHMLGTVINEKNPTVEGELPGDGSRVEGVIPPLSEKPAFNIRKKASVVFPLSEYVRKGRATEDDHKILSKAIKERENILIVGGTGTGKTTFANALLHEISVLCPRHRAVILEDTVELQCPLKNQTRMRTKKRTSNEDNEITMQDLLKIAMRRRPDRIIVGEVRGKEALDMLKAWNTGHPGGLCTVHANDARAGLIRVEQLVSEVSQTPMRDLIAETVNIVVFLQRDPRIGPKLEQIVCIEGVSNGEYIIRDIRNQSAEERGIIDFEDEKELRVS